MKPGELRRVTHITVAFPGIRLHPDEFLIFLGDTFQNWQGMRTMGMLKVLCKHGIRFVFWSSLNEKTTKA